MSLTIHSKYKYFDSTVPGAEDRQQKFHFCPLPFAINAMLNLSNREIKQVLRQTANGKNETFAICLKLFEQLSEKICIFWRLS